jgi:hypothetical protein
MTFFYELNQRMAKLAAKQDAMQTAKEVKSVAPRSQLAEALEETDYSAKKAAAGKDIGKPGKNFSKIAKSAGARYGSKAAGERVAGAVLNKLRHAKEDVTDEGNAFTGALKATPKGGKFKVGGKEFTDTSSLEEGHCPTCDCSPCKCDSMEESALQAYLGNKKYGKEGMDALRKAGREHAGKSKMNQIRNRYDKMDEADMEEGNEFTGNLAKAKAQHKDEFEVDGKKYKVVEADPTGLGEAEIDEGYAEMDAWLKSREKEKGTGKFDKKERTLPSGMKATTYTRKPEPEDNDDTEVTTITIKKKGRPAGTKRAIGAKHSGRSKLASKDAIAEEIPVTDHGEYDQEGESAKHDIKTIVRHAQALHKILGDDDNLPEWVQSKLAKIEGMMIAVDEYMQNQDQEVSEKASKVKEEGSKPDFLDMDKDGDKKESMKKAVADKKGKKVDETTTSGSVATAPAAPKASKSMQFGKGVYEGINSKVETMIAESMNVTVNMSTDEQGQAQKSITVTATDEDADKLAELLKMAGLGGHSNQSASCSQCGEAPCGCAEVVDENSPDWPTNTEKLDAQPELRTYSGGLNGPKSTGQTTVPVVASQLRRQTSMEENVELERSLFKLYDHYKAQ